MKSERVMTLLFALLFACGCASDGAGEKPASVPEKKLKAAFYVDEGSRSNGVFYWARLLSYSISPQDASDYGIQPDVAASHS